MLGSMYTYCSNICPVLKRNQNATFGAHRPVGKVFPPSGSNRGPKNMRRLLWPLEEPGIQHAKQSQQNIEYAKKPVCTKNHDFGWLKDTREWIVHLST